MKPEDLGRAVRALDHPLAVGEHRRLKELFTGRVRRPLDEAAQQLDVLVDLGSTTLHAPCSTPTTTRPSSEQVAEKGVCG
mgnify:CR=1 FL=1